MVGTVGFFEIVVFFMFVKVSAFFSCRPPGSPSIGIEFLNLGGWLAEGDLALESQAHFLAVAEH